MLTRIYRKDRIGEPWQKTYTRIKSENVGC